MTNKEKEILNAFRKLCLAGEIEFGDVEWFALTYPQIDTNHFCELWHNPDSNIFYSHTDEKLISL